MLTNLVQKKLKLGLWVSLLCFVLPFYGAAQNSTTINVKRTDREATELSLSWSIYNNEVLYRDLFSDDLSIVFEDRNIEVTQFKLYVYKDRMPIEFLKINGNQLTPEAIEILKRIKTTEPIAIMVSSANYTTGKPVKHRFPTFFFFVR